MSERTAPALAKIDALLESIQSTPKVPGRDQLIDDAQALRSAIASFHMEAIRFRMYSVDRALRADDGYAAQRPMFEALRADLETAGFHTRSHTAP